MNVRKLIIAGTIAIVSQVSQYNEPVVEVHEITNISGEEIRGENISGFGEGIFYYKDDFCNMGVCDIKVGDKVEISWTKSDFYNENWDNIHSLEKKSKFYRGKLK